MSEELYFNDELRKCLNAAGLSDCGENDLWNYWYQRVHKAHDQAIDSVTKVQRTENAKLRDAMYTNAGKHALQHMDEGELRIWATQQSEYIDQLEELVRDMWRFTGAACKKYPRLFDPAAAGGQTVQLNALDAIEQRMRELGIEDSDA